ncbi:GGDEF domain-containing protein [Planosporangium flavigriseum]|uniref:GGDEF domain-containing protein n=1 Tax=Planosporangium flavigriseum TaxID=373681 RepID=A0A8J3LL75_9ACTN|nr:GGDEF domain-containing protein [Planosporangium flavigriseum]NJC66523.1 GGDEF domain-containing protein [Planosporangium flavigriseum]GIG73394.1 hypothetical protein Pfl04_17980 [Planosporangium flavigriseum]
MEILSPTVRIDADPQQTALDVEVELARLRAQVARLEAERAALRWAVGHDDLTGLANRRRFHRLASALLRASVRPAAVIVLDLNGFKPINDRLGHDTGDRVLCVVARRLSHCVGDDLAARLGGDEFAAVLTCPDPHHGKQWWKPAVTTLSATIAEPMAVAGHTVAVTASIGVAPAHGDAQVADLLREADQAMYQAKASGSRHSVWGADPADAGEGTCQPRAAPQARSAAHGHPPPLGPRILEFAIVPSSQ